MRDRAVGIGRLYFVVLFGIVFITAATASVLQINRERDSHDLMTRTSIWITHQIELELLKFQNTLDIYRSDLSENKAQDVQFRFDILWSRVPVALTGREGEEFRNAPGAKEALVSLKRDLVAFDPLIQGISDTNQLTMREISHTIGDYAQRFREISLQLNVGSYS